MYTTRTGLVLGFHGCDESVAESVLLENQNLGYSYNKYDWLGHGIYFWENSPSRALEYANILKNNPGRSRKPVKKPAVLGAVINLGYCLDLLDYENLQLLKGSYELLCALESEWPENYRLPKSNDLLIRNLDCAVIQTLHTVRSEEGKQPYDSVRGVFWEGEHLYPNAGFREKDHIQLCVINPNCIKGFFRPRDLDKKHVKV